MKIVLVHAETKQEVDATCFTQATYHLHDSFADRAKQGRLFLAEDRAMADTIISDQGSSIPGRRRWLG